MKTNTSSVSRMLKEIEERTDAARKYLLSKIYRGLCLEFHQIRHGASHAWTSACVGSSLAEVHSVPDELISTILKLQQSDGGWSYNHLVSSDADSTLRVLQFLKKIGSERGDVIGNAENFVLAHQQSDGGFATFRDHAIKKIGYGNIQGWTRSHPC